MTCDLCGHDGEDDETGTQPVFADESAALHWLTNAGWQITPGHKLTCHQCAAAMACVREGHAPGTWWDCMCKPDVSGHPTDHTGRCVRQFAWCTRCEHRQYGVRDDAAPTMPGPAAYSRQEAAAGPAHPNTVQRTGQEAISMSAPKPLSHTGVAS
ncbi:hypothetical protein ACFV4N_08385 [Actinosynnema sp. NPDC059797]